MRLSPADMRFLPLAVLSSVAVASAISSESQLLAASIPESASLPQPTLSAASSQSLRRALALPAALLGHWETDDGRTRYYFGSDHVTVINQVPSFAMGQSAPRQITQVLKYQVLSIDETRGIVRLAIETPLSWATNRMLQFDANHLGLTELMSVAGHTFNSQWTYVDSQQTP